MEYLLLALNMATPVILFLVFLVLAYYAGKVFWSINPLRWVAGWVMLSMSYGFFAQYYPYKEIAFLVASCFVIAPLKKTPIFHYLSVAISAPFYLVRTLFYSFSSLTRRAKPSYSDMYEEPEPEPQPRTQERHNRHWEQEQAERFRQKEQQWQRREREQEEKFRQKEREFEDFKRKSTSQNKEEKLTYSRALSIFGLSEPFDKRALNKEFKKLRNQYHPDKNVSATEAVKKLAEEKFKEVYQSYDLIKKTKGF